MARPRAVPFLEEQIERQRALGRSATQVDIFLHDGAENLNLSAGPRTVLIGSAVPGSIRAPWQLYPQADLDHVLRTLHAQVLEEAHDLPELLRGMASADPEAAPSRNVQHRLKRMLSLRSMLELTAAWEDAAAPGQAAPGWASRPERPICVLPWHRGRVKVGEGWHLHHLRRWHRPHLGADGWEEATAGWITSAAFLQDAAPRPLSADPAERQRQRSTLAVPQPPRTGASPPVRPDLDADAFVRRVRWAMSLILEPALAGFEPEDVLRAVQGSRNGTVVLSRLLPGVAAGPVQALAVQLGTGARQWRQIRSDEGTRSARVAGTCPVRRSSWTAARAGGVQPYDCLAAEAAGGPLHLLVPGIHRAGPTSGLFQEDRLSTVLAEVKDLFAAAVSLPAEQDVPLPDLGALLTGRGYLRLGAHALSSAQTTLEPGTEFPEDWQRERSLAMFVVPGLTEAMQALQAVNAARERTLAQIRSEVCQATGLSEGELEEATGGERAFDRAEGDAGLERTVRWTGGVWSLLLARHPQDLVSDGRTLSHCVGWGGYAQTVRTGRARIVRVLAHGPEDEVPRPLLTLELRRDDSGDSSSPWHLVQARGASNRPPTRDEATLLGLWAREVGVRTDVLDGVIRMTDASVHSGTKRLAVNWATVPASSERSTPPTSGALQQAAQLLGEALAAQWTPAATRRHQEGLRRVAQLVERAKAHLTAELLRLHGEGDARLVGSVIGDDLLRGTGVLTLAADSRPDRQALLDDMGSGTPRVIGLRIHRQIYLEIGADLRAREHRQTLDLRPGKRPGEIAVCCSFGDTAPVNTSLSPAALMNTGMLDPLHVEREREGGWTWGVARRRQVGLTFLWSLLDDPLGELETAAAAVTGQAGGTLRVQLDAWTRTVAAVRSVAPRRARITEGRAIR